MYSRYYIWLAYLHKARLPIFATPFSHVDIVEYVENFVGEGEKENIQYPNIVMMVPPPATPTLKMWFFNINQAISFTWAPTRYNIHDYTY